MTDITTTDTINNLEATTTTNDALAIIKQLTNKPIKFITPTRTVRIKNASDEVLFEGETELTRKELEAQFEDVASVEYKVLYTTVNATQTYTEALTDPTQISMNCFSQQEFEEYLVSVAAGIDYKYIAYNEIGLKRQKKTTRVVIKKKYDPLKAQLSIYFFTSLDQLEDGRFPIKGISPLQIQTAKEVLTIEDAARNEFIAANPEASPEQIKEEQVESVLFLVGSTFLIDAYIKMSNLSWIKFRLDDNDNEVPIKGLIKEPIGKDKHITMLLLNVKFKRNIDVMQHVGW